MKTTQQRRLVSLKLQWQIRALGNYTSTADCERNFGSLFQLTVEVSLMSVLHFIEDDALVKDIFMSLSVSSHEQLLV